MLFSQIETPCYVIRKRAYLDSVSTLMREYGERWGGEVLYGYSVKTNRLPFLLETVGDLGWYAEVVSPDEYAFAASLGFDADRIIYNGPQKRAAFLEALEGGAYVNLDHFGDVGAVCAHVKAHGAGRRNYHLGVRVNFDLEARCPGETAAEGGVSRFGLCLENGDLLRACRALRDSGVPPEGLHMHASTLSRSARAFREICLKALEVRDLLASDGFDPLRFINVGGGFFGGSYFPGKPSCAEYARAVCDTLREGIDPKAVTLILEPGAAILATALDYVVSVLNIRQIRGRRVVTVDGSSLHVDPMMKGFRMPFTLEGGGERTEEEQIVGGSTCMEADRFRPRGLDREISMDSRLVFHCAGAYTVTHNSSFINCAPNVYVEEDGECRLLRKKTVESMLRF